MTHPSSEHFLTACGANEPLRVVVGQRDGTGSETWSFQRPFLVIGRRPESDLMLDHWQVSRRHTYLQLIDGRYYCVDLGSRTGTHGGDATERSGWLEPGRAIQIGPFAVRPECPEPADRPENSFPGVTWELPGRAIGRSIWRMDRHLALIGRSPACKVRIVEPDVSKFHCSVVLTALGVWAVDLLGQNGVFVNDQPVRCARLEDGDSLRVGRHTLRARYDTPPRPLPQAEPDLPPSARGALATILPRDFSPSLGEGRDIAAVLEKSGGAVDPSVNLLVHQFGMMQQQMFDQFHHTMTMMFEGFAALHREQSGMLREELDRVGKLSEEIEALRAETARLASTSARPPDLPKLAINGHSRPASPTTPGQAEAQGPPIRRVNPTAPEPGADIHAQLCLRLAEIQAERQNRWQKILGMMSSRS